MACLSFHRSALAALSILTFFTFINAIPLDQVNRQFSSSPSFVQSSGAGFYRNGHSNLTPAEKHGLDHRSLQTAISWLCDLPALGRACTVASDTWNYWQSTLANTHGSGIISVPGLGNAVGASTLSGKIKRYTIPYAEAPVRSRRFSPTVAKIPWTGTYNASLLPPACPQSASMSASPSINEDCLFMNIYTPASASSASNLPVFVWLHGGSFVYGSSSDPAIEGSALSDSGNMVVVTVQYRLGILGFLRAQSAGINGNMGLLDVIQALKTIKSAISAFGGNPSLVTLAGQSSGADIIKTLLTVPVANTLFNRAILHSAPLNYGDHSVTTAESVGAVFLDSLASNCTSATSTSRRSCLQTAKVEDILDAQDRTMSMAPSTILGVSAAEPIRPVVDGQLVQGKSFLKAMNTDNSGLSNPSRQIIFTTVINEAAPTIAAVSQDQAIPTSYYESYVRALVDSDRADKIIASGLYNVDASDSDSVRTELEQLGTDWIWRCANQQAAVNITLHHNAAQVWLAQFDAGITYSSNAGIAYCKGRVCHQDDIQLVFQTGGTSITSAQSALSSEIAARWSAFARAGSPNTDKYVQWQPVAVGSAPGTIKSANLHILVLNGVASKVFDSQSEAQCSASKGLWGRSALFDDQIFT